MPHEIHLRGDEKLVITQDGQRVDGQTYQSVEEAEAAKAQRQKLAEAAGNKSPNIAVVQQLNG